MWSFMMSDPTVMASTVEEGVNRVRNSKGRYRFFVDVVTVQFQEGVQHVRNSKGRYAFFLDAATVLGACRGCVTPRDATRSCSSRR